MQASGDDLPAARPLAGYRYGNRADAPVAASRPVDTGLLPGGRRGCGSNRGAAWQRRVPAQPALPRGRPASPTAPPLCDRPGRMPAPPERLLTLPSIGLESGPNNRDRGRPTPK